MAIMRVKYSFPIKTLLENQIFGLRWVIGDWIGVCVCVCVRACVRACVCVMQSIYNGHYKLKHAMYI